jgi:DNA-directed RNA polymerase specialized sigma24 family protein
MSSTAQADSFHLYSGEEQPFFWIGSVDEDGALVDKRFAQAAYEKVRDFRLYRAHELLDEAVRADLVEKAVYAASRAEKSEPVRDVKAYVFATFARFVDERIIKERDLEHASLSELEQLHAMHTGSLARRSTNVEDAIVRREILDAMPPGDRRIWERRLLGYRVQQIAADMNVSAKCMSMRMNRAIDRVAETLRRRRAGR